MSAWRAWCGSLSVGWLAAAAVAAGCGGGGDVRVVPVFPADEQDLFDAADVAVEQVVVEVYRAAAADGEPAATEILGRGEPMHLGGLDEGPWKVAIRGRNAGGEEVVYGLSRAFEIVDGKSVEVKVFVGRRHAFNRVALQPADLAGQLAALRAHTATAFVDGSGAEWILVAGGYPEGGTASGAAYLIDVGNFTVERLESSLSEPRMGHTAVAIAPPGRAPVVVIAAGGGEPVGTLDVYDSETKSFSALEVPCGAAATAGVVPALAPGTDGALAHSGRVILPGGAQLCVVDPYGESPAESWPMPGGEQLAAPAMAAVDGAGNLLTVDAAGVLRAGSARERAAGEDPCAGAGPDAWDHVAARVDGALVPIGSASRFAVVAGSAPEGGPPASAWAEIKVSGCAVTAVVEGFDGGGVGIARPQAIDLSGAGSPFELLVGGGAAESARTAVLIGDGGTTPQWYEQLDRHTPSLRAPRTSYAVAALANRSAWVIGGNADDTAEVFEIAEGGDGLPGIERDFARRRPVLTTMTVLDETEAAADLRGLIDEEFLAEMFAQDAYAALALFGSSNRGIGDDLMIDYALPDEANCMSVAVEEDTIFHGVAYGEDLAGINTDGVEVVEDNSSAIESGQDAISATTNQAQAYSARGVGNAVAVHAAPPVGGESTTCHWRQLTRVGFDGLVRESDVKDATYSGVNVVIWVTAGDDCSQGLYHEWEQGADEIGALPDPATLESRYCSDPELDDYFALPPAGLDELNRLREVVGRLRWDPRDLIVAVVAEGAPDEPEASIGRRLYETIEFLRSAEVAARFVPMLVEDPNDPAEFAARLGELTAAIQSRNPLQSCVPENVVDFPAQLDAAAVEGGLFVPTPEDDYLAGLVAGQVVDGCRLFSTIGDGAYTRVDAFTADWSVGTDTDRRAGCEMGWTIQIAPEAATLLEGELHVQCVTPAAAAAR